MLVTNEGNGRLSTSLPPVHIALVGVERLVPRLDDLAVLIPLLAGSGTGQAISTYLSLTSGPRREGEVDGPEQMHVVIVDGGRSSILGTGYQEILHCIRCGACQNVCPVYRQVGGHAYGWVYGGPIGAVLTPLFKPQAEGMEVAHASSLCAACDDICPVEIPLHDLLLDLRRDRAERRIPGRLERSAYRAWSYAWSSPRAVPAERPARSRSAAAGRALGRAAPGAGIPRPVDARPRPAAALAEALMEREAFLARLASARPGPEQPDLTTLPGRAHRAAGRRRALHPVPARAGGGAGHLRALRARRRRRRRGGCARRRTVASRWPTTSARSSSPCAPRWRRRASTAVSYAEAAGDREQLGALEATVTGCAVAVAATGSIVTTARGGPRGRADRPAARLRRLSRTSSWAASPRRSGACRRARWPPSRAARSRTADIEKKLILGMHGPGVTHVIITT